MYGFKNKFSLVANFIKKSVRDSKIKEKENEKAEKKRQKELKAQAKSSGFSGPLFELPEEFSHNGYIYTKEKHGVLSDFVIVQVFIKGYFMVRLDENGFFELQGQKVSLKTCKQVRI